MNFLSLIERKRDGGSLTPDEVRHFVEGCASGALPEYQVAAFLMAVYFRGLSQEETRILTTSMRDSGEVLVFPRDDSRPVVDKHSTGGIGDKISLPLAPLLACLGFRVPMISGRGLGITGGTLDKLESITGFRTSLSREELTSQVERLGVAMGGQTDRMCPADRILYSLRDVTGTVPSIPLIAASILSKKLAEGISALVLDVKHGVAAFMQTREQARELAATMTAIANEAGVRTRSLLTDMNRPLGRAAGNWLEVRESAEVLEGRGPQDVRELVIECAAQLLELTGRSKAISDARREATAILDSGQPKCKWIELIETQGGDTRAYERKLQLGPTAPVVAEITSATAGFIAEVDARSIGEVIRDLGGGRVTKLSVIDADVGVDEIVPIGTEVDQGAPLCRLHARSRDQVERFAQIVRGAFRVVQEPVLPSPRIVETL